MLSQPQIAQRTRDAIKYFWETRQRQAQRQGSETGRKDAGARAAMTGGAQMDGFVRFVRDVMCECGLPIGSVYYESRVEIPGWYRSEKKWDLLAIVDGRFLAAIEFKSQIGPSFGNNFNNRAEEAIGSAVDLWAAYREGAFRPSHRPWLGYVMLIEECPASTRPVRSREPFFHPFPEFVDASYVRRYEILLSKLVHERLYDAAGFVLSDAKGGPEGIYREPQAELSLGSFLRSLAGRVLALPDRI